MLSFLLRWISLLKRYCSNQCATSLTSHWPRTVQNGIKNPRTKVIKCGNASHDLFTFANMTYLFFLRDMWWVLCKRGDWGESSVSSDCFTMAYLSRDKRMRSWNCLFKLFKLRCITVTYLDTLLRPLKLFTLRQILSLFPYGTVYSHPEHCPKVT